MDIKKIVIAGASGYIGKSLIPKLIAKFPNAEITALSRSKQKSKHKQVTWVACDLFSLKSIEEAVPGDVDLAFYLVHSMGPTAQLDQGSFADYDLILADNFARTLKATKIQQLIYLGGLLPDSEDLSLHLKSRLEVESVFNSFNLPLTIFRAGLILGESGSSFQILLKLVKRLPVMICPAWTQSLTSPVGLDTVLTVLTDSASRLECIRRIYDIAGCRPLSYLSMMKETARKIKKKRLFFKVPFFTPTLSRLWVCLVTGSSKNLVYPLVESLKHEMVARKDRLYPNLNVDRTYFDLLDLAIHKDYKERKFHAFKAQSKTVRSVQRLSLPKGKDATWSIDKYMTWLPRYLAPFIKVNSFENSIEFSLFFKKWVFLGLKKGPLRSDSTRQLLYITNGLLVDQKNRGRLEFREVLSKKYIIAAIHDYKPSLPWFVYVFTQAKIHLWVMRAFSKYMKKYETKSQKN